MGPNYLRISIGIHTLSQLRRSERSRLCSQSLQVLEQRNMFNGCFYQGETCDCSAATAHEGTFCHTLKSTACSVTCTATKFSGCTGTTCVCNPGITGALCETAAAICTGANAATLCGTNGACHRISSADTCFCNPGYGGTTCSTEIKCTKTPTNCTQCRMETGVDKCKKCKDGYALPTCKRDSMYINESRN